MDKQRLRYLAKHVLKQRHSKDSNPVHMSDYLPDVLEDMGRDPHLHGFCMDDWRARTTDCGTVGCLAAHTCYLWGGELRRQMSSKRISYTYIQTAAAVLLKLDHSTAYHLFCPKDDRQRITPEQAAKVLLMMADEDISPRKAWSIVAEPLQQEVRDGA